MTLPIKKTYRPLILGLVLALSLTACGESMTGVDGEDPDPPDPQPRETSYILTVTTHFIQVIGSCDTVFGQATQGEFQYRYEYTGEGEVYELESQGFDSRFGVVTGRVAGQFIDFDDKTYTWRKTGDAPSVSVKLFGTEWDGAIRDGRMSRRSGSKTVPFKDGSASRTITIGATKACQIVLHYTAEGRTVTV
ncbi:MAG: hypothetical protein D6740_11150 [Alphaproteobacteria bacterium]|nr:MAG: hypothetical protein D6740_11150 [Alphaproteobacteria bacterium]